MDRRKRTVLLHAAIWLKRLNGHGRPYPEHVLTEGIRAGERLQRWTCHEDDDFTFGLLEQARLLGPPERYSYDALRYELTFEKPSLREHLAFDPFVEEIDDVRIVRSFVEQLRTSPGPRSEKLVPSDESWFQPWNRLIDAFDVLVAEGFAQRDGRNYRLSRRLLMLLAEWGWSVDLDSEAHKQRLIQIWNSMPAPIKRELTVNGTPGALELAMAMGYYWDSDEGWTYPSREAIDPDNPVLQGGHIPDAIGIVELLRTELFS